MSSAILGGHQLPICLLHCLHNKSTIQLELLCKLTHVIQYVLHSNSNSDCTPTAILSYFRIPCNGFNSNILLNGMLQTITTCVQHQPLKTCRQNADRCLSRSLATGICVWSSHHKNLICGSSFYFLLAVLLRARYIYLDSYESSDTLTFSRSYPKIIVPGQLR